MDRYFEGICLDKTCALHQTKQTHHFAKHNPTALSVCSPVATWEYPPHLAPGPTLPLMHNFAIHYVLS